MKCWSIPCLGRNKVERQGNSWNSLILRMRAVFGKRCSGFSPNTHHTTKIRPIRSSSPSIRSVMPLEWSYFATYHLRDPSDKFTSSTVNCSSPNSCATVCAPVFLLYLTTRHEYQRVSPSCLTNRRFPKRFWSASEFLARPHPGDPYHWLCAVWRIGFLQVAVLRGGILEISERDRVRMNMTQHEVIIFWNFQIHASLTTSMSSIDQTKTVSAFRFEICLSLDFEVLKHFFILQHAHMRSGLQSASEIGVAEVQFWLRDCSRLAGLRRVSIFNVCFVSLT